MPHDVRLAERGRELAGADADRERGDADERAVLLHAVRRALEAQDARAGGDEVARVVVGVEADEVRLEDAAQELLAKRQRAVVLAAREGRVQEEAHLHGRRATVPLPPVAWSCAGHTREQAGGPRAFMLGLRCLRSSGRSMRW